MSAECSASSDDAAGDPGRPIRPRHVLTIDRLVTPLIALDDPFEVQLQRAQLEYVCSSEAAARSLAENYVGLDRV